MSLSREDIELIAHASAKAAVPEVLALLGIDASDPMEMQRDFAHLRNWRRSVEAVQRKALLTSIGIIISGIVAAIWVALKSHG